MTKEEAIETIKRKLLLIVPENQPTGRIWKFRIEKLVLDILDYCHRQDFPEALIYTCVDLILKRMADEKAAVPEEDGTVALPLSEIKMDDTSFKFDTNFATKTVAANNVGLLSDLDFESIKPKLNLYRKVVSR